MCKSTHFAPPVLSVEGCAILLCCMKGNTASAESQHPRKNHTAMLSPCDMNCFVVLGESKYSPGGCWDQSVHRLVWWWAGSSVWSHGSDKSRKEVLISRLVMRWDPFWCFTSKCVVCSGDLQIRCVMSIGWKKKTIGLTLQQWVFSKYSACGNDSVLHLL